MNYILKNGLVYDNNGFSRCTLLVSNGYVQVISSDSFSSEAEIIDVTDKFIFPGFVDVHVHLREPGFIYKESVLTGTLAAAHGGYTTVCSMPNLSPAPDSYENLKPQLDAIEKDALINVLPFGTITVGQKGETISQMEQISPHVCGFSDDGRGVQNSDTMLSAMKIAKSLNKIISAHCEDNSLLNGGYIHDGEYAKLHSHKGISSESEWKQVLRDVELAKISGVKYHVCHISTKESVEIIRKAKKDGVDITCETAPHYLILSDMDMTEDAKFKMNPPLRSEEDRRALIEGVIDNTIDMIATDHAPHSLEEKSKGLEKSLMGVVGLETAFSVLYTELVMKNVITLEKLIELMSVNPRKRFNLKGGLSNGDITIFDLNKKYKIDPKKFLSKGRSSPFDNREVFGECVMTICGGKIVCQKK